MSKKPKSKEYIEDSDSDSGSCSDEKPAPKKEKVKPPKKKQKHDSSDDGDSDASDTKTKEKVKEKPAKKKKKPKPESGSDDDDNDEKSGWELGRNRKVSINEFRGKVLIDIREYYDAGGEMKPGRKGISFNREQWENLLSVADKVNKCLK